MASTQMNTLTNKNLQELFSVSHVTIFNWRDGSAQIEALPVIKIGKSIRYSVPEIKAWAKRNGKTMEVDPKTLVGTGMLKPGPKKSTDSKPRAGTQGTKSASIRGRPSGGKKKAQKA